MKKLFLPALILSVSYTFGQSIKSQVTDKFTGVITTSTTKEPLAVQMGYQWVAVSGYHLYDPKEKEELFTLVFALRGQGTGSLRQEESKITLLTDQGESMQLPYTGKYNLFTTSDAVVNFFSTVTKDQLAAIAASRITDIRIYTSRFSDHAIKKDRQTTLAGIAQTLLNESKSEVQNIVKNSENKSPSLADELKKLKDLLDTGALTQEEYDAAKKKLLEN